MMVLLQMLFLQYIVVVLLLELILLVFLQQWIIESTNGRRRKKKRNKWMDSLGLVCIGLNWLGLFYIREFGYVKNTPYGVNDVEWRAVLFYFYCFRFNFLGHFSFFLLFSLNWFPFILYVNRSLSCFLVQHNWIRIFYNSILRTYEIYFIY